jgi:Flp pilus assembly protein TadG
MGIACKCSTWIASATGTLKQQRATKTACRTAAQEKNTEGRDNANKEDISQVARRNLAFQPNMYCVACTTHTCPRQSSPMPALPECKHSLLAPLPPSSCSTPRGSSTLRLALHPPYLPQNWHVRCA